MAETAALLVDEVLPRVPLGQWVLSLPFALRYLLATRPEDSGANARTEAPSHTMLPTTQPPSP